MHILFFYFPNRTDSNIYKRLAGSSQDANKKRLILYFHILSVLLIRGRGYSIGLTSPATLKGASVFDLTSSTVTLSASSTRVRPSVKSTSNTHCNTH